MDNKNMINEALRSPLAAADPSLGHYALSVSAWNAIKGIVRK